MSVDPSGYFMIENVPAGTEYKLIARAKNGERMLAGFTYTTAPNSHLLIKMREDFANAETPPLPGAPTIPGKNALPAKTSSAGPDADFTPTVGSIAVPFANQTQIAQEMPRSTPFPRQTPSGDDAVDLPVSIKVPVSNGPSAAGWTPPAPTWTPPARPNPNVQWPPFGEIKAPTRKPSDEFKMPVPPPTPPPPTPMTPDDAPPPNLKDLNLKVPPPPSDLQINPVRLTDGAGPARVPSCVVEDRRLVNFALYEINGTPWEYRQHTGKIVLLDFWGTWCGPCVQTIPKLRSLKQRYGSKGLEIIGIACEQDGPPQAQAHRVNSLCLKMHVNYRQLLSSGADCPVVHRFDVQRMPTLVLLDEQGSVIWRHTGLLDSREQDQLERLIQRQLNVQP